MWTCALVPSSIVLLHFLKSRCLWSPCCFGILFAEYSKNRVSTSPAHAHIHAQMHAFVHAKKVKPLYRPVQRYHFPPRVGVFSAASGGVFRREWGYNVGINGHLAPSFSADVTFVPRQVLRGMTPFAPVSCAVGHAHLPGLRAEDQQEKK